MRKNARSVRQKKIPDNWEPSCTCGHRKEDHAYQHFLSRDCLLEACGCKLFDGTGARVPPFKTPIDRTKPRDTSYNSRLGLKPFQPRPEPTPPKEALQEPVKTDLKIDENNESKEALKAG